MRQPRLEPKRAVLPAVYVLMALALANAACADQSRGTALALNVCAKDGTGQAASASEEAPGLTPIGEAALSGDFEAVKRQIDRGADVNAVSASGQTPLMLSFQPLILPPAASGEDPDATRTFKDQQLRKLEIARLLLDASADPALADCNGMTSLHHLLLMHAEERDLVGTLEILTKKGADPNAPTAGGVTALMLAAQRNLAEVAKSLLSLGADPDAAAKDGRTALSIARARGHDEITELLLQVRR